MILPTWMRIAMLATAVMNLAGAYALSPFGGAMRRIGGLPEAGHPFYAMTLAAFVLIFGLAYFWAGVSARADRLFVAVAAAGKLAFFALLTAYWAVGQLPLKAPLGAVGDLVFGSLFVVWLTSARPPAPSDR